MDIKELLEQLKERRGVARASEDDAIHSEDLYSEAYSRGQAEAYDFAISHLEGHIDG